jgi:hypothetical protein
VLEGLYKSGKARAIGVSNYNTAHVQELLAAAEVKPMVNQVGKVGRVGWGPVALGAKECGRLNAADSAGVVGFLLETDAAAQQCD